MSRLGAAHTDDIKIVRTGACYDCGGRCVHKVFVKDGKVVRVETDDSDELQVMGLQLRSCLRGRALRQHLHHPDRLRYPLKRVGARGEGKFERISWDEALDTVAAQIRHIRESDGDQAILATTYAGKIPGWYHQMQTHRMFGHLFGKHTRQWGEASSECSVFGARSCYGTLSNSSTRDDWMNSRLIILWGIDPAVAIFGTNTSYHLAKAKEAGARIISIDPKHTDTNAAVGDQWIPIKPGTDSAMAIAMAYVMITENLHDQRFLEKYTVGFAKYKDYVLGLEDGVPKTAEWAAAKTGVPADTIVSLAREYAATKPAALVAGTAPGRTAYGEQFHRAASALAAMTGNIGIHGGDAAAFHRGPVGPQLPPGFGRSKVDISLFDIPRRLRGHIHIVHVWDAFIHGKAGGYPADVKMYYLVAGNPLNQFPNINKGIEALKKLEFIVIHENFMTATAKFADILLPATMLWERNDFARPWMAGPYFLYLNRVVEPLHDVKDDIEVFRELGRRLGVTDPAFYMSDKDGIRQAMEICTDMAEPLANFEKFKEEGIHRIKVDGPQICFKKQIEDPENNPFPTPSGKIEIYSDLLAQLNNPEIPPIPKHFDTWEGPEDPLIAKYPLQLITIHHKARAHSNFDNTPWLREADPQRLSISGEDARARGIADGDHVRVFNDRGVTVLPAKVTERIMPGVVAMGQGAWYQPDALGRDRAGSSNILTRDHYSPGGGFPSNTALVEVQKFVEEE